MSDNFVFVDGRKRRCDSEVATEVTRLRAEVERLKLHNEYQRSRLAYMEGATNHATGTALTKAIDRAEKAEAEVERLTKDRDDWKAKHWKAHDDCHRQFLAWDEMRKRAERAEAALHRAAVSLEYIARDAGKDEELLFAEQVRGYANSRAIDARAALDAAKGAK